MRKIVRRLGPLALLLTLGAVAWALPYGPLFPWSPLQPGYTTRTLERTQITWPADESPDPALLDADSIVRDAERFHALGAPTRIRIIHCKTWSDYFRFLPINANRAIAGAALMTGNVVYLTPKLRERNLPVREFLRHEISHAILGQNTHLWHSLEQQRHTWLYEGVPVWFGQQQSYDSPAEFARKAKTTPIPPLFAVNVLSTQPDMRFAYVAWSCFLADLEARHGHSRFLALLTAFRENPSTIEQQFETIYGTPFATAVQDFALAQ